MASKSASTSSPLRLDLDISDDGEPYRIDELSRALLVEIRELGLGSPHLRSVGDRPPATKTADPILVGALTLAVLPTVLPTLITFLKEWCLRKNGRSVKVKRRINDQEVDLEFPIERITAAEVVALIGEIDKKIKN